MIRKNVAIALTYSSIAPITSDTVTYLFNTNYTNFVFSSLN